MLLKDYMNTLAAAEATGEYTGRDMILAVDCTENGDAATPNAFAWIGCAVCLIGLLLEALADKQKSAQDCYVRPFLRF